MPLQHALEPQSQLEVITVRQTRGWFEGQVSAQESGNSRQVPPVWAQVNLGSGVGVGVGVGDGDGIMVKNSSDSSEALIRSLSL